MKAYLRKILGTAAWLRLAQFKYEIKVRRKIQFATDEISQHLEKLISKQNGFYVEVGANDGRSSSNTYYLERKFAWNGILIEPILHKHFESKIHRDSNSNEFIYGACVSENYESESIKLYYSNLMTSPDYGKGQENANKGKTFLSNKEEVVPIWAPALTLKSIMAESNVSHIDFLSIDVEGGELEVLEGFDWTSTTVDLILIESTRNSPALQLLLDKGFIHLVDMINNHIFIRKIHTNDEK
jgi:FkbM family methyltransferase